VTKLPVVFMFSSTDSVLQLAQLLENMADLADFKDDHLAKEAMEWSKIFKDFVKAQGKNLCAG
jgi:hypothetical protein